MNQVGPVTQAELDHRAAAAAAGVQAVVAESVAGRQAGRRRWRQRLAAAAAVGWRQPLLAGCHGRGGGGSGGISWKKFCRQRQQLLAGGSSFYLARFDWDEARARSSIGQA